MYQACYLFRVPSERVGRFLNLEIASEAATLYRRHGAIDSTVALVTDAMARYGCQGLLELVPLAAGEQLFVGVDSFTDRDGFNAAMKQIDLDARVIELYREMTQVIDLSRTVRWESEQVV